MNTKDYIESGILEAYTLGALTPDEDAEVEANIASYPELLDELVAIEAAMQQYGATMAKEPPGGLQDKIWNTIQQSAAVKNTEAPKKPTLIPLNPPPPKKIEWKLAAAIVVLTGSLALNFFFWRQEKSNIAEAALREQVHEDIKKDRDQLAAKLSDYQKEKAMMADTAMQTIVMHTVQPGHPMAATVYWSKKEGVAYVAVDALPAPPQGMQYQLWVMQDGKPVDMGVIANDLASTPIMQKVAKAVTSGQAFAISLEKAGGSPTPTMANIYVMGVAS